MAAGSDSSFAADVLPSAWTSEHLKNTECALQPARNNTIYRAEVLAKLRTVRSRLKEVHILPRCILRKVYSAIPQKNVLVSLIKGAVEFPDTLVQKTCFSVLKRLVEAWSGGDKMPGFVDVLYKHIVPACFGAPLQQSFDLSDGNAFVALGEISGLLLSVISQRGPEFFHYLKNQYLSTLQLSPELNQHLLQTLQLKDAKTMKNQLKVFFKEARQAHS